MKARIKRQFIWVFILMMALVSCKDSAPIAEEIEPQFKLPGSPAIVKSFKYQKEKNAKTFKISIAGLPYNEVILVQRKDEKEKISFERTTGTYLEIETSRTEGIISIINDDIDNFSPYLDLLCKLRRQRLQSMGNIANCFESFREALPNSNSLDAEEFCFDEDDFFSYLDCGESPPRSVSIPDREDVCTQLIYPENESIDINLSVTIEWHPIEQATEYQVSVGTTPNSWNIAEEIVTSNNETTLNELPVNSDIYVQIKWRSNEGEEYTCDIESFKTHNGDCPSRDILLTSQAEIDAFRQNYPNCTEISGKLEIRESVEGDITYLRALEQIRVVNSLIVHSNSNLSNLEGLHNITLVNYKLEIINNSNLISTETLNNITSIGNGPHFLIQGCESIENIGDFPNLLSLGYVIFDNLPNLTAVPEFSMVEQINGTLVIRNLNVETTNSLNRLNTVRKRIIIENNINLKEVDFLNNVVNLTGGIHISNNDNLENIDGLSNINLEVFQNGSMGYNVQTERNFRLYIDENLSLTTCHNQFICDALSTFRELCIIEDNAAGCETAESVIEKCYEDICTQLVFPENGSTDINTNITVEWQPIEQATGYQVSVGTAPNSWDIAEELVTSSPEITLNDLPYKSEIYVQIKWLLESGIEFNCDIESFKTHNGDCPSEDIFLTSQEEIDAFPLNYPNCTEISGILQIQENEEGDITNLSALEQINSVANLIIDGNSNLTSLEGLNWVINMSGYLHVKNNPTLTNLSRLTIFNTENEFFNIIISDCENLREAGVFNNLNAKVSLILSNLPNLTNVPSFPATREFEIIVLDNVGTADLSGLNNLERINGSFTVSRCQNLVDLNELISLRYIAGPITFEDNINLFNINALLNVSFDFFRSGRIQTIIGGPEFKLKISDNTSLSTCNNSFICQAINELNNLVIVNNNSGGCLNSQVLLSNCQ